MRLLVLVDLQDFEQDVGTLDLGPDTCHINKNWLNINLVSFGNERYSHSKFFFATVIVIMVVAFGLLIV